MSFFNMKSWMVKFRNFLDDFPVHYAALFINRTINNNYDFINGLALYSWWNDIFLDATRITLFWHASNFYSANKKYLSSG